MQKIKIFNVNWTLKDKNLQQSCHLKIKIKLHTHTQSLNALH
jgi:hypothetical protein